MSSPLVLGSQSPGQYAHPVHAPEAPRARPMFAPGTVWHAAELADFKELEKLIAAGPPMLQGRGRTQISTPTSARNTRGEEEEQEEASLPSRLHGRSGSELRHGRAHWPQRSRAHAWSSVGRSCVPIAARPPIAACGAGKDNGYHESVVLQQKEDLLGMMPIHVASEKGHVELVQYLIKKRVDLDAGDKYRVTALHLAAIEVTGMPQRYPRRMGGPSPQVLPLGTLCAEPRRGGQAPAGGARRRQARRPRG